MPPRKKTRAHPAEKTAPTTATHNASESPSAHIFQATRFVFASNVDNAADLKKSVASAAGKVYASLAKNATHLVATPHDISNPTALVRKAQERSDIAIVSPQFITDSLKHHKLLLPNDYAVSPLAAAPSSTPLPPPAVAVATNHAIPAGPARKRKAGKEPRDDPQDGINAAKEMPNIIKYIKKGSAVVDPQVPSSNKFHVHELTDGTVYDCMLNQSEIASNSNKFYVIQLLKSDSANDYACWTRWGRVGYSGQNSMEHHGSNLDAAVSAFEKKFKDKTKNDWVDRTNFVKYSGKYHLIERDLGNDDDADNPAAASSSPSKTKEPVKTPDSKLDPPLQRLINLIYDTDMYAKQMSEIGYDANKMPLGKLTKSMIQQGYNYLKQIAQELQKTNPNQTAIKRSSSDFYTVIPHDFGFKVPPVINTKAILKAKLEMCEILSDIQIATTILKNNGNEVTENPLDANYHSLKTELNPIDTNSHEFKLIEDYVKNTHGATHGEYVLQVEDVFEVKKEEEHKRFRNLHNRQLLWHGSRLTNWVGILSQSLRIAPPEAPVTGYMFGKGVYFADIVSKSANYCFTNSRDNTGLLLLCEVALGDENHLIHADYDAQKKLGNKHSTKGVGRVRPNPDEAMVLQDGVKVPCGKAIELKSDQDLLLQYSEFIVYDVNQIKMRYLIRCKFNYRK
ncbi:hypothetical protein SeLEV6574_g05106 [Synchytrium endobioticum]|nr:hypothetical protein SeLEV6574_g05106 [Synchytrium endobioticum]